MESTTKRPGVNRGHVLIAAAVLVAGIIVAYVFSSSSDACEDWRKRDHAALVALAEPGNAESDVPAWLAVHDQRPEGCR